MKRKKRAKRYAVYLLVRLAAALLSLLPLPIALGFGRFAGLVACWVDGKDRRRAIEQIQDALGLDGVAARALARRAFENVGRVAVEIAVLPRIRARFASYVELTPESLAVLQRVSEKGRGALFVSAHLGSWELLAQRIAFEGFDAATFARKGSNPYLARWLIARRASGGLETIARGDPRAPRQIIAALRRGAILGALIDQDTRVESVHVPFFGRPAATPVAPVELALRSNLPVIAGFITRKPAGFGHVVHIAEVDVATDPARSRAENAREATARLTRVIEDAVRRHPEEWVWFHARWKTPPPAMTADND